MPFRASFCDPFKPDSIDMGEIAKDTVVETFQKIPWLDLLEQMKGKSDEELFYSPSLEIENTENKSRLLIVAVGEPEKPEYYIFYKRPRTVKGMFGFWVTKYENYVTNIGDQTEQDVLDCLNALTRNELEFLENKIQ